METILTGVVIAACGVAAFAAIWLECRANYWRGVTDGIDSANAIWASCMSESSSKDNKYVALLDEYDYNG